MCRKLAELIATVPVLIGIAFAQSAPQNLAFEDGQPGAFPQGWAVPTPGYAAKLTPENAKAGRLCLELARNGESTQGRFGNLMQSFDATAYRGKRVRFRAAVRISSVAQGDRAQLWLRVDRHNGEMGFFDNMDDRPIREWEWRYYEITGDIEADADRINIGMILLGSGKAWIDDASFDALGETPTVTVEAARAFGYVRYFHPLRSGAHARLKARAMTPNWRKNSLPCFLRWRPLFVSSPRRTSMRYPRTCFRPKGWLIQKSSTGAISAMV